jgi:RNA polymerase sigma-70 factor (ECF subfamily)
VSDDEHLDRQDVDAVRSRGDEEAFRRLYRRHAPALYTLARRLLGADRDGAEDITQETWLRAVSRFPTFEWRSSLRSWLSAIVINCCRERWRSRTEILIEDERYGEPPDHDPLMRVDLETALALLSPGYRAVLVLHDVMGMTHEEIAARLTIEPGTSKSQLSRARRAMRRLLGEASPIHTADHDHS